MIELINVSLLQLLQLYYYLHHMSLSCFVAVFYHQQVISTYVTLGSIFSPHNYYRHEKADIRFLMTESTLVMFQRIVAFPGFMPDMNTVNMMIPRFLMWDNKR